MSKSHPQQWTVVEAIERPLAAAVAALARHSTMQIADRGGPVGVVGPGLGLGRIAGQRNLRPRGHGWTKPGDILACSRCPTWPSPGTW